MNISIFPRVFLAAIQASGNAVSITALEVIFIVLAFLFAVSVVLLWVFLKKARRDALEAQKKNEEISALNKELSEYQQEIDAQISVIDAISGKYFCAYIVDVDKNYFKEIFATPNMSKLLGTEGDASKALELAWKKMVVPADQDVMQKLHDISNWESYLSNTDIYTCEYRGITSGWSRSNLFASERDKDGRAVKVVYTIEEIHKQKELEEKLIKARDEAEEANRSKSRFLFNMSHDIRTPMNAILGFSNLMERELNSPELLSDHLSKIREAGTYLLSLIDNILDMARIENGKISLKTDVLDLRPMGSNLKDLFERDVKAKKLEFTSSFNIIHPLVYTDEVKVREITTNIISNAIKYTPEGGKVHVDFTETPISPDRANYTLTVADTGIGMSEEFLDRIFDSFARERNTTESGVSGTGLGMAIVKKFTEMLGGTINIESTLGVGTTVTVTLPHHFAEAVEKPVLSAADKEAIDLEGRRILVAEDNDLNAEITAAVLKAAGMESERAADGRQCVEMLDAAPAGYYDLILMDIQMPEMNGYEAAKVIRNNENYKKASIPIIAMTANAFESDRHDAIMAGMDGHLAKPVDAVKLTATIAENINI